MARLTSEPHKRAADRLRQIVATYECKRDLISLGAYKFGTDPEVDEAIDLIGDIEGFLRQGLEECSPFDEAVERMKEIVS